MRDTGCVPDVNIPITYKRDSAIYSHRLCESWTSELFKVRLCIILTRHVSSSRISPRMHFEKKFSVAYAVLFLTWCPLQQVQGGGLMGEYMEVLFSSHVEGTRLCRLLVEV